MTLPDSSAIFDVAIVGAGIAGLTAAALLAHDGAHVLLLEAHDKPGGCAGYFAAGEWQFPVGATVALGLEHNGLHRRVFDYLNVHDYEAHLLPSLKVLLPDRDITFWHDATRWQNERRRLPGWGVRHERFWKWQETVADAGWEVLGRLPSLPLHRPVDVWRNLRLIHPGLWPLPPSLPFTMEHALQLLGIRHDRELRTLINLLLIITVQTEADRAPLSNGCAGIDLFRHGAWHLRGGLGEIARLLWAAFQRDEGVTQLSTKVLSIQPQTKQPFCLHTSAGEFRAQRVIANVPLPNLNSLLNAPPSMSRRVHKHLKRGDEQWGAANLYIAVRDEVIPADAPLHQQVLLDYEARPGDGLDVFLSLSYPGDLTQAPQGWRALNVSTHTHLSEWENLSADEYRQQKRDWRERMLRGVRRALPQLDEGRKFVITGTPQSWHDYTLRYRGGVGGVPLTLNNANLRATPQRWGVENFWLVGDSTFPGQGTVACALSGINAWRDITGKSTL